MFATKPSKSNSCGRFAVDGTLYPFARGMGDGRDLNFVQMTEGVRMPRRPHEYATWTYPGSSAPYEFGFLVDGAGQYRWISFRRLPSTPAPPPPAVPLFVRRLDSGGRIFWGQVGPALWLACCVAAVALAMVAPWRAARAVASTGLAVAIVMCAAKFAEVGLYSSRCFWPNDSICWGLFAIAASLELCLHCRDQQRNRRESRGLSVCCGYDLTGNISGTCPECGERRVID